MAISSEAKSANSLRPNQYFVTFRWMLPARVCVCVSVFFSFHGLSLSLIISWIKMFKCIDHCPTIQLLTRHNTRIPLSQTVSQHKSHSHSLFVHSPPSSSVCLTTLIMNHRRLSHSLIRRARVQTMDAGIVVWVDIEGKHRIVKQRQTAKSIRSMLWSHDSIPSLSLALATAQHTINVNINIVVKCSNM